MAEEFPNAEFIVKTCLQTLLSRLIDIRLQGVDLAPVQKTDIKIPDNLAFIHEDVTRGLSFPDGYFDVIHTRVLFMGVSI